MGLRPLDFLNRLGAGLKCFCWDVDLYFGFKSSCWGLDLYVGFRSHSWGFAPYFLKGAFGPFIS